MRIRRKKRDRYDISVIPMIDVFMVLLIFFIITTTFNRQASLDIKLPEASTSPNEEFPKSVTLSIDAKGDYYLMNDQGPYHKLADQQRATLVDELSKLDLPSKDLPFIIQADAKAQHQSVMTALDAAGQLGFKRITFALEESEKAAD
jgi:biopolymer transport protein ExbD